MRRFLNRLLGLPVHRQNLLFNYFAAMLAATIRQAKAEGRFSEGMSDLPASQISFASAPQVRRDFCGKYAWPLLRIFVGEALCLCVPSQYMQLHPGLHARLGRTAHAQPQQQKHAAGSDFCSAPHALAQSTYIARALFARGLCCPVCQHACPHACRTCRRCGPTRTASSPPCATTSKSTAASASRRRARGCRARPRPATAPASSSAGGPCLARTSCCWASCGRARATWSAFAGPTPVRMLPRAMNFALVGRVAAGLYSKAGPLHQAQTGCRSQLLRFARLHLATHAQPLLLAERLPLWRHGMRMLCSLPFAQRARAQQTRLYMQASRSSTWTALSCSASTSRSPKRTRSSGGRSSSSRASTGACTAPRAPSAAAARRASASCLCAPPHCTTCQCVETLLLVTLACATLRHGLRRCIVPERCFTSIIASVREKASSQTRSRRSQQS